MSKWLCDPWHCWDVLWILAVRAWVRSLRAEIAVLGHLVRDRLVALDPAKAARHCWLRIDREKDREPERKRECLRRRRE